MHAGHAGDGKRRLAAVLLGSVLGLTVAGTALGFDSLLLWFDPPEGPTVHASRAWITEKQALRAFPVEKDDDLFVYDPVAALRPRPGLVSNWNWKEHPDRRFTTHVNDIGLMEREPVPGVKSGPRILIAGDSHTAGIVGTDETFANVLEARLGHDAEWAGVDVLNGGCAYTGPRCYRGTFEKYLHCEPDVFVAVLFVGNDFFDDLYLDRQLSGEGHDWPGGVYKERLERARTRYPFPIFQGFNLPYRWKEYPEERELSFELVVDSYLKMSERCAEEGVRFLAVVLPTKMEVDKNDRKRQAWLLKTLELSKEDMAALSEMGDRFVREMQELGIPCLDPRPAMRAADEPLYWSTDYHLNHRGHALVAKLLERELRGDSP